MITDHKIKSIVMTLSNSGNEDAITVTTVDDGTFSAAPTTVGATINIDNNEMPTTDLSELESMANALLATHTTLAGI